MTKTEPPAPTPAQTRAPSPGLDFGAPRRHAKGDAIRLERAGRPGRVRALVESQTALDRYFVRGNLDPGDARNNRLLHDAGARLRADWTLAGLEPAVTGPYAERVARGGIQGFMAAREDAYIRWRAAIRAVGPIAANEAIEVCCMGNRVGRVGLEILRRGLAVLAVHYREEEAPR